MVAQESAGERRYWIGVVSGEHVAVGREDGFIQVCHGRLSAIRRVQPGDGFVYYSPTQAYHGKDRYQHFTAIGTVRDGIPYQVDMGAGFVPHRRDVAWFPAEPTPIQPLLDRLDFTAGKTNWGYQLRFGLFPISAHDFQLIADAMRADPDAAQSPSTTATRVVAG